MCVCGVCAVYTWALGGRLTRVTQCYKGMCHVCSVCAVYTWALGGRLTM